MAEGTEYVPVNVPIPLIKEVDKLVKQQKLGFRSRNEFCVAAIREKVEYYKSNDMKVKE